MKYQGAGFMSNREAIVFSAIESYRAGELSRREAALLKADDYENG